MIVFRELEIAWLTFKLRTVNPQYPWMHELLARVAALKDMR